MNEKEEIAKLKLKIEALKEVTSGMGIFPLGAVPTEERESYTKDRPTAYKAGWNDAIIAMAKELNRLERKDWGLMSEDALLLLLYGGAFIVEGKLHLNMNDTFAFACADDEEVPDDKIVEVTNLYRKFGYDGLTYWVSKQRNWMMPHAPDGPMFKAAAKEIKRIRKVLKE